MRTHTHTRKRRVKNRSRFHRDAVANIYEMDSEGCFSAAPGIKYEYYNLFAGFDGCEGYELQVMDSR